MRERAWAQLSRARDAGGSGTGFDWAFGRFSRLKAIVREIMGRLDHQFVNDLEPFKTVNPSAENMAKYFYDEVTRELNHLPAGARVTDVILWETDTSRAQYRPGN